MNSRPAHSPGSEDPDGNIREFTEKYESSGRIGKWLVQRFFDAGQALLEARLTLDSRVLEIGCGPGYSTARMHGWSCMSGLIAGEPSLDLLAHARRINPCIPLVCESVYDLAHSDRSFDAVVMLEVLEHLERPAQALAELHRVTRNYVLISTPREPIWRALNMARGKYLGAFGNTPGHIQHWSARGLKREVSRWFHVEASATPLPWTILLLSPKR